MQFTKMFLIMGFLAAAACRSPSQPAGGGEEPVASDVLASVPGQEAGWSEVSPGGQAKCTDGSEFYFLTRSGDPEKLLFYLEGGGGCWNKASCDPNGKPTAKLNLAEQKKPDAGVFDLDNPANPFSDYSFVYVPYCSGDVHIGQNDIVYPGVDASDSPLQVYHHGRANVQAALDWVSAHHPILQEVFVSGSSAGAVPTPLYASILADEYESAHVASLGDGAGGYRRTTPMTERLKDWGVLNHITDVPGFEDLSASNWSYEQIYIRAARAHPGIAFTRFDYSTDPAQWRFLSGNSQFDTFLENLLANNEDIRSEAANFQAYVADGEDHTVLQKPAFYDVSSDGVALTNWVGQLAEGEPVDDATCAACVPQATK